MTVLEVIQRTTEFLAQKGVESPRLNIEEMLAHVLKMRRLQLYLNFERKVTEGDLDILRQMVKRRAQREPLQHILGSASFCGLEIAVSRDALIPRPETELLAEKAIEILQSASNEPRTVLDFGTGTGCIPICVAVKIPGASLHAVDVSEKALDLARKNASTHQVSERIQFHLGDGFSALPPGLQFDMILSNPPYIPSREIATLQPEVRDFDPVTALDGGQDGLNFYRQLSTQSLSWIKPGGTILLEMGDGQSHAVSSLFTTQDWENHEIIDDYSRRPRIFLAKRRLT